MPGILPIRGGRASWLRAGPWFLLAIVCIGSSGCHSGSFPARPTIKFVDVPLASPGDPNALRVISGTVAGARPDERIVLYAKTQTTWWIQPYADRPFTSIRADATWQNTTHPGEEYAALVVGPSFRPILKTDALPKDGVIAQAITKGNPPVWARGWFLTLCALAVLCAVLALHRVRMIQMANALYLGYEERLDERMRVAEFLHDTLLQDVISASMQLHVAVSQLPAGSPAVDSVNGVLRSMTQTIEEARTTLRGLRSSKERVNDLVESLVAIPREVDGVQSVGFRVTQKGRSLPLRAKVCGGVYHIAREALANALREPGIESIEVRMRYTARDFRFSIRYHSIPFKFRYGAHGDAAQMQRHAEAMGAKLKLGSGLWQKSALELRIPGEIAFESSISAAASE